MALASFLPLGRDDGEGRDEHHLVILSQCKVEISNSSTSFEASVVGCPIYAALLLAQEIKQKIAAYI
jgi:hypothetical protein